MLVIEVCDDDGRTVLSADDGIKPFLCYLQPTDNTLQ